MNKMQKAFAESSNNRMNEMGRFYRDVDKQIKSALKMKGMTVNHLHPRLRNFGLNSKTWLKAVTEQRLGVCRKGLKNG